MWRRKAETGEVRDEARRPRRLIIVTAGVVVLANSILLMLPAAWWHSVTVVEFAHLPAGLSAWQRHSLGIYRVCGPVSKLLFAWPAYVAGVRVDCSQLRDLRVDMRQEWSLGDVFQRQHCGRYHDIYRWSRLVPMLLTVIGGILVWEWATRLFGGRAGIVSLCLWCWMPPILAHGALVTSDMASAVLLLLASRTFWLFLLRPTLVTALGSGVALGLAAATKFTLLILYPSWILILLGRVILLGYPASEGSCHSDRRAMTARLMGLGPIILALSVVVVDGLYFFQDVGVRLAEWKSTGSSLVRIVHALDGQRATAWLLQIPLPIPWEFVRGLDAQLGDTERLQSAYLFGRIKPGGWWYWYAVASLIKVPLPALILFAWAASRALTTGLRRPATEATAIPNSVLWALSCLAIPALELALAVAITTGTGSNAAYRYLLPSLASMCVLAGLAGSGRTLLDRVGLPLLLAWLWLSAISGVPDHLGWQNEIGRAWRSWSGRPALIGDSLDWGQDVARLSAWVAEHYSEGTTMVCVYGFGGGEPYGLKPPAAWPISLPGERAAYLAVSEDVLHGYESNRCIELAGANAFLRPDQCEALRGLDPYAVVGRTIRVYRMSDLSPDLFPR
jgi:hypothetical protein